MFGRGKERNTLYTMADVDAAYLKYLETNRPPPKPLGRLYYDAFRVREYISSTPEELEQHNVGVLARRAQKAQEGPRPLTRLRRVMAAAATVFIAGARR